ncbi:MAG: DNRLRE domain-containing protein, partial [Verrucomicrobiaceae bacterium]|nr:DNRLRE domain-containing protein [Verrucomicrobiaceae bacterium]
MATGDTLGGAFRTSMNSQIPSFSNPVYSPANFGGGGTHLGLMGDPSLRMHVVAPPRHLAASSVSGSVSLAWAASAESGLIGYHVYRAASVDGPFTRLTTTPQAGTTYNDASGSIGTAYTYMVRVLKNETAPGGTYENLSLGEMATITVDGDASSAPANATGLAVVQNRSVSAQLTWQDNSADETGFRIERKTGAAGSFTLLTTAAANATSHTDAGPFGNNETYYYRVIALNAAGDGIPSNEASFDATPGFFEFNETYTKVSKTVDTAQIAVRRFGGVNGPVTVNYATSDSSAIAGTHFTAASGMLTWADGETGDKFVPVPVTNTPSAQMARQFRLTLSTPSSGTGIGTYNAISVLIEDPTATLPGPWAQSIVGTITDTGFAVQAEGGFGSTTMGGSGLSTAATSENGQFIYQTRTGDGVMTAFVPAATPAQTGARFAVMVRESATAGGTPMAGTAVSTASGTFPARQVSRATSGGTTVFGTGVGAIQVPCWLRITRAGNSFQSEASTDGTTWINQGTATVTMASAAQWGLFHTSDDRSGTTYSGNYHTASFQNVTFTTVSVPGAVGSFTAGTPTANSVALTWTAAPAAGGYRLERRGETGGFAQIIDLPSGTLNFTDAGLASNSGYEYRIYAYNSSGNGPLSSLLKVTTTSPTVYASLEPDHDATIKGGATGTNFGSDTVLRVGGSSSQASLATNSKVYMRFNLTGLPATATGAMLRLTVAAAGNLPQSGYQFASPLRLFPEVQDEAWTESTVTWDNGPLNNTAGNDFLTGSSLLTTLRLTDPLNVPSQGSILTLPINATTLNSNRGANDLITLAMHTTTTAAWMEF